MVTFAFGLANFFASPILGALSDAHGRRPVLLLGFCGLALSFLATALATAMWMLIAVRLVSGAMQANMSVANAYVADITPPEERAKRFGMLGAMFGLGFILGPVMGGLLGAIDLRLPFFVAGSLALLNLLYGYFVLPESLPAERRRAFDWKAANPVSSLRGLAQLKGAGPLVAVVACSGLAQFVLYTSWVLYTTFKFGWGPLENGWSLAAVGIVSVDRAGAAARAPAAAGSARGGWPCSGWCPRRSPTLLWGAASAGLDDVRGHLREPARRHGGRLHPEHHLRRRGRAQPGPGAGRGGRPEQPDGGGRPGARRAAAGDGVAPAAGRLAHRRAVLFLRRCCRPQRWSWR